LKIAGVVNDYKEALDIEDIVKAFVIRKRIFYLLSLEKKKDLDKIEDSNIIESSEKDIEFSHTSHKKNIETKNEEEFSPVFNVRGLI
jgi:hypothetical protein